MADRRSIKKTNICFDCEKAVCGCSWAKDFIPPEGSTYQPVYSIDERRGGGKIIGMYISACPLFERSPNRKSVGIISEDENRKYSTPYNYMKSESRK